MEGREGGCSPTLTQVPPSLSVDSIRATLAPYEAALRYFGENPRMCQVGVEQEKEGKREDRVIGTWGKGVRGDHENQETYRACNSAASPTDEHDVVLLMGWFCDRRHLCVR